MKAMTIGTLARQTGVKVPTIRYYESVGLLQSAPRSESNRRQYDDTALRRLRFIRHARELGFEVNAIRELLALASEPQRSCAKVDLLAREHLRSITSRMERLAVLRRELEGMVRACSKGRIKDCRVIDALSDHEHCKHTAKRRA
jgi:DNA-binding transcriptional MerR regulator